MRGLSASSLSLQMQLGVSIDLLGTRKDLQRDLDSLDLWAQSTLTAFSKAQ